MLCSAFHSKIWNHTELKYPQVCFLRLNALHFGDKTLANIKNEKHARAQGIIEVSQMQIIKTYLLKFSVTLVPRHSQLDMGVVATIDGATQLPQVNGALGDLGVQEEILSDSHSDGSNSAVD